MFKFDDKKDKDLETVLKTLLANQCVLESLCCTYMCNVTGPSAGLLMKEFKCQAKCLGKGVKKSAIQMRVADKKVPFITDLLKYSTIPLPKEGVEEEKKADRMIKDIIDGHKIIIKELEDDIEMWSKDSKGKEKKDPAVREFMVEALNCHKMLYTKLKVYCTKKEDL